MRNVTAAALLMSSLAVSACGSEPIRSVSAVRPDRTNPERFVCEPAGTRPKIPGEDMVDLGRARAATTVAAAMAIVAEEVGAYVASVRARETVVADYIVSIEGKLFVCGNNMTWQREFYARLPADP